MRNGRVVVSTAGGTLDVGTAQFTVLTTACVAPASECFTVLDDLINLWYLAVLGAEVLGTFPLAIVTQAGVTAVLILSTMSHCPTTRELAGCLAD